MPLESVITFVTRTAVPTSLADQSHPPLLLNTDTNPLVPVSIPDSVPTVDPLPSLIVTGLVVHVPTTTQRPEGSVHKYVGVALMLSKAAVRLLLHRSGATVVVVVVGGNVVVVVVGGNVVVVGGNVVVVVVGAAVVVVVGSGAGKDTDTLYCQPQFPHPYSN